jgi:hypothetical protein
VREAGASHDFLQRHAVKTVAVEEPSSALDDFLSNFMAVSCGIRHGSLLILLGGSIAQRAAGSPVKHYLEHILAAWFHALTLQSEYILAAHGE